MRSSTDEALIPHEFQGRRMRRLYGSKNLDVLLDVAIKNDATKLAALMERAADELQRRPDVAADLLAGLMMAANRGLDMQTDVAEVEAQYRRFLPTFDVILGYCHDINVQPGSGQPVLLAAAQGHHPLFMERILSRGARADVRSPAGNTAESLLLKRRERRKPEQRYRDDAFLKVLNGFR